MRKDDAPQQIQEVPASLGCNTELASDGGNKIGRRFKATDFPCLFMIRDGGAIEHVINGNKKKLTETVRDKLHDILTNKAAPGRPAVPDGTGQV